MEYWVPLFDILLNSPCPETEASKWLQKSFNPSSSSSSSSTHISTSSFLSLLTKPSSLNQQRVMWIQTLPDIVQARVLSFLAYDHRRFCSEELCKLGRGMLSEGQSIDFWVKKGAQHLVDLVSASNKYEWVSDLGLDSEGEGVEDEFFSLPDWLKDAAKDSELLFPWLPMSCDELVMGMSFNVSGGNEDGLLIDVEDKREEGFDEVVEEVDVDELKFDGPVDTEVEKRAIILKQRALSLGSASRAVDLAKEIRELCFESKGKSLEILHLIEPWSVDDEVAVVLISHLCDGSERDELDWPSHVFCSVLLPKLLILNEPCSRLLMTATIEYCKAHQRAAEYALLLPLLLRSDGINDPMCDVITRIVKECLHPAHVSAFCQKLLCEDKDVKKFICLPCHRCLIGDEVVWTESLFSLLRNMLNHNVYLTQDSADQVVKRVCEFVERYSKSLKFGNFVLCLVNKCAPLLKPHKQLLTAAVENTNTIVKKSILSKLSGL